MGKDKLTTRSDFDIFKKECRLWVARLGLKGWRIGFEHSDDYEEWSNGSMAMVSWNVTSKSAIIWLNKNWGEIPFDEKDVRRAAFHEVLELLFSEMTFIAGDRYATDGQFINEKHSVIRTFENTYFRDDYDRRFNNGKSCTVSKGLSKEHILASDNPAESCEGS